MNLKTFLDNFKYLYIALILINLIGAFFLYRFINENVLNAMDLDRAYIHTQAQKAMSEDIDMAKFNNLQDKMNKRKQKTDTSGMLNLFE